MSRAKDKILNKTIGQKIREARAKRVKVIFVPDSIDLPRHTFEKKIPCTQTELGKALNVSFQQIQKYESGHNALSSLKLLEVSNFFKKPIEYFTSDATELLEKVRPTDNSSVEVSESFENV